MRQIECSRRGFLKAGAAAGALAVPTVISGCALTGKKSGKVQVGVIGCGRIANSMDIPGIWQNEDLATVVALADCDRKRLTATARKTRELFTGSLPDLALTQDYRELLARRDVDAVMLCVPDFWHAQLCVEAALAGKDVYCQKPLAMTISEGRAIVEAMTRKRRVFHIGSQQRSEGKSTFGPQFRKAAEFVREGRLGKILRVEVGLPSDPEEPDAPLSQAIPETLDFDLWLGAAPAADYCELRTHPQGGGDNADLLGRPGWMTIQDYDMGMIANWGAHHIDIAQWGLGMEASGPVKISGTADFPKRRLWNTHGRLDVTLEYATGTALHIAGTDVHPNGVRFLGENGWIFCSRGSQKITSSDPGIGGRHGRWRPLEASSADLIEGEAKTPLARNPSNHHRVWLESIKTRRPTNITPEAAHRSTSACILAYTAMNLQRPLAWDPAAERFVGDDAANATLSRPERAPYGVRNALQRAGWKF